MISGAGGAALKLPYFLWKRKTVHKEEQLYSLYPVHSVSPGSFFLSGYFLKIKAPLGGSLKLWNTFSRFVRAGA
jgi:hypothetical protein